MSAALEVYARGLTGPDTAQAPLRARLRAVEHDGSSTRMPLERWLADPDAIDRELLAGAHGPVLDIGCGPGRHVAELMARGVPALGLDLSAAAVALARRRGRPVRHGSIFGGVPDSGAWATVLLLDGNVGIGGDPARLLRRVREVVAPAGELIVELEPPESPSRTLTLRLRRLEELSDPFRWAHVSATDIAELARETGWEHAGTRQVEDRWFAHLGTGEGPA